MARLKGRERTSRIWVFFSALLLGNAFLSYFPFTPETEGWIFVFLVLAPFFLLSLETQGPIVPLSPKTEFLSLGKDLGFLTAAVMVLAVYLRFFRLTDFHSWPTGDEALHGYLALQLLPKWAWQFFYTVGEHPPLLIWTLSLLFKCWMSPLFDLWMLPALFSLLAVPAGYLAARALFNRSISTLFGILLSLSFWPLYFGRFCHQGLFTPALEPLCFWALALWVREPEQKKATLWLALLAFLLGIGSLTFTAWATVVLLVTGTVLLVSWRKVPWQAVLFLVFLTIVLLPFLFAIWKEGYGRHLMDSAGTESSFAWQHQLLTHLSYFSSLFWGSVQEGTSYGPSWGGMLNPVFSSAFFIGLASLWRRRKEKFVQWLVAALIICTLPGLLAADYVELNRIIQLMPLLLLVTTLGLSKLALSIPWIKARTWILGGFVLCGLLLDLNHYLKPVWNAPVSLGGSFKLEPVDKNLKAYRILDSLQREKGNGVVFTEFLPLSYGHSLYVTTYPFNVAIDPTLDPSQASWAAILTNVDYQPFLSKRFPNGKWYWVDNDLFVQGGGLMVGWIPLDPGNRPTFEKWSLAHRAFHQLQVDAEGSYNSERTFRKSFEDLTATYPMVQGEPFLESCYWEWASQYYFGPTHERNIAALRNAVQKGYPAAYLYQRLAALLLADGRPEEARKDLEKAQKAKVSFIIGQDLEIRPTGN